MTITIKNKKVKVRKLSPKKDKIRKTDIWDLSDEFCKDYRYASESSNQIGEVYLGIVPCYRPIKPTRKPSAKRAEVKAWMEPDSTGQIAKGGIAYSYKMPGFVECLITPLGGRKVGK